MSTKLHEFTGHMAAGDEWLLLQLDKIYTAVERKEKCRVWRNSSEQNKSLGLFIVEDYLLAVFTFLFVVVAIYSIALKLHTHCISVWLMLSSSFQNYKTKKRKKENACVPSFPSPLCWSRDDIKCPSPLISKVVSARVVPSVKRLRTRPEVQRPSSLLYPGCNTTNRKK